MYNYPFSSFPYYRKYSNGSNIYYNNGNSNLNGARANFSNSQHLYSKNAHAYNKVNSNSKTYLGNNIEKASKKKSNNSYGLSFLDNFFHQNDRDDDESYFDLFGLKLYNDDLLLIGLILFLYKEDVKDQYLFIALILLLLS